MSSKFDVAVIGAGPGGYVAAIRAAQLGLKAALVEREFWGGVCLNVGCIPTKSLLHNAEIANTLKNKGRELGFSFENLQLDFSVAHNRSRQTSNRLVKGVQMLLRKNQVTTYEGSARLTDSNSVQIIGNDDSHTEIQADNIIIATGARPRSIPGVELDGNRVITYREAILADELPESIVIIGGGPIGVEFAYIWNSYGVKVTILEMMDRLLPLEDDEASRALARAYRKHKIDVRTGASVRSVVSEGDRVSVTYEMDDSSHEIEASAALVAIGFSPNVDQLGLEELGVTLTDRGRFITVDEEMRSSVPNIFAIGDVTGKLMLAHVASAMGMVAAEVIAGQKPEPIDYSMIPRCVYSHPQVSSFGLTEAEAEEAGLSFRVGKFPFMANGKALGIGERDGHVKVLVNQNDHIVGAHLVGPSVTELLPELSLAATAGLDIKDISRNVHAHPTLSEALLEAIHDAEGRAIHK